MSHDLIDGSPARVAAFNTVKTLARDGARRALEALMPLATIEEKEFDPQQDLTFDHWVMAIMLSSRVFKFSFSARFTSRVARAVSSTTLGLDPDAIKPAMAHDSMGEFCNLAVGTAQRSLAEAHTEFGGMVLTTPKSTPSFDIGPAELNELGSYADKWLLSFSGHEFLCAFTVEVTDWDVFSRLQDVDISKLSVSDGGELEFF